MTAAPTSASLDLSDDDSARTPGRRWYHAPAARVSWRAAVLALALDLAVASAVYIVLSVIDGTEPRGFVLANAWWELGLLLAVAVVLSVLAPGTSETGTGPADSPPAAD